MTLLSESTGRLPVFAEAHGGSRLTRAACRQLIDAAKMVRPYKPDLGEPFVAHFFLTNTDFSVFMNTEISVLHTKSG
jgi:hypothetical protein